MPRNGVTGYTDFRKEINLAYLFVLHRCATEEECRIKNHELNAGRYTIADVVDLLMHSDERQKMSPLT